MGAMERIPPTALPWQTAVAEADGEADMLRYRGVSLDELVGRVPFGPVWGLLVANDFAVTPPPAERFPLPAHPGVQVDYAEPGTQALMAKAALAEVTEGNPPFLWFAAERSQATEVRSAWRKSGRAAKDAYISAYWQRRE